MVSITAMVSITLKYKRKEERGILIAKKVKVECNYNCLQSFLRRHRCRCKKMFVSENLHNMNWFTNGQRKFSLERIETVFSMRKAEMK